MVLQKSDHFTHFKNYPLVFSLSSKYPVEIVKGHVCFLSKVLLEHTHAHSLPYCYGYCHSGAEELVSWPKSVQPAKPLLTLTEKSANLGLIHSFSPLHDIPESQWKINLLSLSMGISEFFAKNKQYCNRQIYVPLYTVYLTEFLKTLFNWIF